jgi:hypothetical protein
VCFPQVNGAVKPKHTSNQEADVKEESDRNCP